ncbi:MAG: arginine--tRNA ligase [Deltaproteobacteria bacterium]
MQDIQPQLRQLILKSLEALGLERMEEFEFSLASGFGDISCNVAFKLAGRAKQPPKVLAQKISEQGVKLLAGGPLAAFVKDIKAEGAGFVNFYLSTMYYTLMLKGLVTEKEDFLRQDIGKGLPVLIEYVSANPTGSLSVAHARQAAVGDALAGIMSFIGYKVAREYYLNDEGNQINILGRSVQTRLQQLNGEQVEFPANYYQGDYITDMAREIKEKKLKIDDFGQWAGDQILAVIKKELADFQVQFDNWYSQKALAKSGKIEKAFEELKKKGLLFEEEGALWFRSTQFGDDKDRVVIKSDGSQTYLAPDIAYHKDKYDRGFKRIIDFLGPDHHGYIARLKASVQAFGHDPDSLNVVIVQLASIFRNGKAVEMSTRKGQYITLREVLDEVGVDASRFFFLMRRTTSHLQFDLEVAKKQTPENPVYYVQYAHARISSILRQESPTKLPEEQLLGLLKEKEEQDLLRKLWEFGFILFICAQTSDPYMMTVYLQETAESFHRFYDKHRVLGNEDKDLTQARLYLIMATRIVLATGLRLIGVSAPEKM